jgi:hypothetical protein
MARRSRSRSRSTSKTKKTKRDRSPPKKAPKNKKTLKIEEIAPVDVAQTEGVVVTPLNSLNVDDGTYITGDKKTLQKINKMRYSGSGDIEESTQPKYVKIVPEFRENDPMMDAIRSTFEEHLGRFKRS